jgi:hypothetical protein
MAPLRLSRVLLIILFFWITQISTGNLFAADSSETDKETSKAADTNDRNPQSGEENSADSTEVPERPPTPQPAGKKADREPSQKDKRKYFVPDLDRVDAGVFHVALLIGGNFYFEPAVDPSTLVATGNYFNDFGFQAGVNFDYDYSALSDNIPLELRGFVGYKWVLSSVNVFTFDGVVRRMFKVSPGAQFGVGVGGSAAIWYRVVTSTSPAEEVLFLPSFIVESGFDFDPLMVEFKWLVNQIGPDATRMGFEFYFGIRI